MSIDFITIQLIMYLIYTKVFFPARLNKYIGWTILFGLFSIKQQYYPTIVFDTFLQYQLEYLEYYFRYGITVGYFIREFNKTKSLFLTQ
jgi:hypothetical protein